MCTNITCSSETVGLTHDARVSVQAGTVRDSMAKSLYGALFDWIVFRTNHALLYNKDLEDSAKVQTHTSTIANNDLQIYIFSHFGRQFPARLS